MIENSEPRYMVYGGKLMDKLQDQIALFSGLFDLLENHFGKNSEIVLHDWSCPYEHTIIDIRNGHVTKRKIGDCGSNLGLEVMRGTVKDDNRYNYITNTRDGKVLRSSTLYIRNSNNEIIGAVCVNTDISETLQWENWLKEYNQYDINGKCSEEFFANDVNELFEYYVNSAQAAIGKSVSLMNKEEKINFISIMDKRGAFLISKASERMCNILNISKFTLYKYLETARGNQTKDEDESACPSADDPV
jgi:predicted transcriptional regulator YheO